MNNPLKFIDPDGRQVFPCLDGIARTAHAEHIYQKTGYVGETMGNVIRDKAYRALPDAVSASIGGKVSILAYTGGRIKAVYILKGSNAGETNIYKETNSGFTLDIGLDINATGGTINVDKNSKLNKDDFTGEAQSKEISIGKGKSIYEASISQSKTSTSNAGNIKENEVGGGINISLFSKLKFIPDLIKNITVGIGNTNTQKIDKNE